MFRKLFGSDRNSGDTEVQKLQLQLDHEAKALQEGNKILLKGLENEKEKICKDRDTELATLKLKQGNLEHEYQLKLLAMQQAHDKYVQENQMKLMMTMLEKGYDKFAFNYTLAGASRTLHKDRSVSDRELLDDIVRHESSLNAPALAAAPFNVGLADNESSPTSEEDDSLEPEPEAMQTYK